jgi:hypothetical protein
VLAIGEDQRVRRLTTWRHAKPTQRLTFAAWGRDGTTRNGGVLASSGRDVKDREGIGTPHLRLL